MQRQPPKILVIRKEQAPRFISDVASLREKNGLMYVEKINKANILNSQFSSTYSSEDITDMPKLRTRPFSEMPDILVGAEVVYALLMELKLHTASGPDSIPPSLLT